MVFARFFSRNADQVALNRVPNRALHRALFPALHANKGRNQAHVPAAMSVSHSAGQRVLRGANRAVAEVCDLNRFVGHLCADFTMRTHDVNRAPVAIVRKRGDRHRRGNAVFKLQHRRLMIDHVVVAMINASAIGPFAEGFLPPRGTQIVRDDRNRPTCEKWNQVII